MGGSQFWETWRANETEILTTDDENRKVKERKNYTERTADN